jgi:hypothetical protein
MSPEHDPGVLLARIDRLERRVAVVTRTLSVTAALLVLVVVAVLASNRGVASAQGRGAAPAEIIASRFKLVDAAGRPRAVLSVDGDVAGLAISDPAGQTRVVLNTDGASSKLALIGASQGFPRINLTQQGDFQTLVLEDAKTSHIALIHSGATPSIRMSSGENAAEVAIAEVFSSRSKPTLAPRLTLTQGSRTLAALPATPPR